MNDLGQHLAQLIRVQGPISIARYMAEALGHPKWGYYMTRDPFGMRGDFITAPEVSQMFGEMIGLWCAAVWELMGAPNRVHLVEIGPGRGTLLSDALRSIATVPAFRAALRIHLVETSPYLRIVQQRTLARVGATWHESLAHVPGGPLLLVANELFDALPIRQFQRTTTGWRERLVDLDQGERAFRLVLAPVAANDHVPAVLRDAPIGSVAEVSPASLALASELAARVGNDGGAALVIDYGASYSAPRETLQAVRNHGRHEVLDAPGEADLCAHVDFGQLALAVHAEQARIAGPIEQGQLLRNLGIEVRAALLKCRANAADGAAIDSALARLTDPGQMGSLFKAMAITHPSLSDLPGFEAAA